MVNEPAAVRGVAAAFLTLSSLAVFLRCYVRLRIVRAFGWDDLIMVVAMLFYAMYCGCMIGGALYGTGKHLWEITPRQQTIAMEYWFLCEMAYVISSILAKISICIFLLRVMVFPFYAATLYLVTAFVISTGIAFFVLLVIQCSPVSFWWRRMGGDADGHCGYMRAISIMFYIFSAASATFDLTVGLLPIILVNRLQMGWRTKAAVAGLLGMACIASIAVIIRIPFIHTMYDPDFLYATVQIAIWTAVEIGLSITAGSLATTRPLLRLFSPPSQPMPTPSTSNDINPFGFDPAPALKHGHGHKRAHSQTHSHSHSHSHSKSRTRTRNNSIATTLTTPSRRGPSLDKPLSQNQSLNFYEPYLGMGMQMSTLGSSVQVEGGCGDEFGESLLYPAAGLELLNSRDTAGTGGGNERVGRGMGVVSGKERGTRSVRSVSSIGVRRTFELSSEGIGGREALGLGVEIEGGTGRERAGSSV